MRVVIARTGADAEREGWVHDGSGTVVVTPSTAYRLADFALAPDVEWEWVGWEESAWTLDQDQFYGDVCRILRLRATKGWYE